MTFTPAFPDWLVHALDALTSGDIEGWMAIYAPDAAHEFPFAPEGSPTQLQGHEEIRAYMNGVVNSGLLRFGPFRDIRVRETGDETIVETTGHTNAPPTARRSF